MRGFKLGGVLARAAFAFVWLANISGCTAGYWTYAAAGGGKDAALGEQETVDYARADAIVYVRDALRGEGILFDSKPDDKIVTLPRDADTPASMWGSVIGVHPQYHYEIEVVAETPHRSTIVVNVVTNDIADNELDKYKASTRLDLFKKVNELAAQFPPTTNTPAAGGVNYSLLPNEDLKSLAKRATGNADNWTQIAQDNGIKSATDLVGVKSVWVRNTLIPPAPSEPAKP